MFQIGISTIVTYPYLIIEEPTSTKGALNHEFF
jgi:hypothetical protein